MELRQGWVCARRCPRCGAESIVYDSRQDYKGRIVRNRKCLSCGIRFQTVESFSRFLRGTSRAIDGS